MFIEHNYTPRAELLQDTVQLATIDVTSLPMRNEQVPQYCVYCDIQGVGVTAYRIAIQQRAYCEAEEVGQMLRGGKKNSLTIVTTSVKYGKYCFLAKHEVSKCTTYPVLDGTLRS